MFYITYFKAMNTCIWLWFFLQSFLYRHTVILGPCIYESSQNNIPFKQIHIEFCYQFKYSE